MRSVESFPEMEYDFCVHFFPKVGPLACVLLCILLEMVANLGINLSDFDDSDVLKGMFKQTGIVLCSYFSTCIFLCIH